MNISEVFHQKRNIFVMLSLVGDERERGCSDLLIGVFI